MRRTLSAPILVLVLCAPVFAGDIPMVPAPQPPPAMKVEEPATNGDIPTPSLTEESVTQSVVSWLESVLALL